MSNSASLEKTLSAAQHVALPFLYYGIKSSERARGSRVSLSEFLLGFTPCGHTLAGLPAMLLMGGLDVAVMGAMSNRALGYAVGTGYTGSAIPVAALGAAAPVIFLNAVGLAEGLRYDLPQARQHLKSAQAEISRRIRAPLRKALIRKLEACKQRL
jgi:hypothetical protein